jgi:16S rRNA (uracil1498-N3)-methyltransferase
MAVPYFYFAHLATMPEEFVLNENSSRHIVQVLRMQPGEQLQLTNGKGLSVFATIREANKKRCVVFTEKKEFKAAPSAKTQIGISLLKNASRFEWFLEKATELGISSIVPLKSARTEKQQFRMERMRGILESAMIQSQQVWMPELQEPKNVGDFIKEAQSVQKFIAHCEPGPKKKFSDLNDGQRVSRLILIGPEGDFTKEEIQLALDNGFVAIELGENRLRSETAAVAVVVAFCLEL